jgi:HTH-type transcriptional regulator / antitoxin HipB
MTERQSWRDMKAKRAASPERARGYQKAKAALEWGEQVREEREAAGLTQAELAAAVGTSQPAIARLEAGGVSPTLDTLSRVAEALGLELVVEFRSARVA